VRGAAQAVTAARFSAGIAWIALRRYRNPLRAARAVGRLHRATRQSRIAPSSGSSSTWISRRYVRASGRYFWDLYAPGWPSPAFDRFVESEFARVDGHAGPPGLHTAVVAITKSCALQCEHCFEWDVLRQADTLSLDQLREIVRRLRLRGAAQVFFSGGEPLRRFDDLLTLIAGVSADVDAWVLTSGAGFTAARARGLRSAGATGVALSLDHWNPDDHDRFRGLAGSFAAVQRAAERARETGLVVALSLCPTRAFVTAANLDRYADVARQTGAAFIQILEPKAVGHYAGRDVTLDPGQRKLLEAFSARLNAEPGGPGHPTVAYLDWSARTFGCAGAGDRHVYVDTDGLLRACPFCRTPGATLLDSDPDAAFAALRNAGCGAAGHAETSKRSPS